MTEGKSSFVYVTYIRAAPEELWKALTTTEFIRKYWFDMSLETSWEVGAPWRLVFPDGRLADLGEIVEMDPPRRLVLRWRNQWKPEFAAEGETLCTMEIEPVEGAVKLTVSHTMARPDSKLIAAVSGGWPHILSNLKSLLETGETLVAKPK
jgi:uncharacterized protein YndB with AHSA1/START domain